MFEINNQFIKLNTLPNTESAVLDALLLLKTDYIAKYPGEEEAKGAEFEEVLLYLRDLKLQRDKQASNPSYYNIPTRLIDRDEQTRIVDKLVHLEQVYSPDGTKAGYLYGTATVQDETREHAHSTDPKLVTTGEHATDHATGKGSLDSGRKIGGADWGVGGLSDLIAYEFGGITLTMPGRQTGNGNGDPDHPFGQRLSETISAHNTISTSLQLHGAAQGKVARLNDELPLDVLIGLGDDPNDSSIEAAELIKIIGAELGLRVGINQKFIRFEEVRLPSGLVVASPRPRADGSSGLAYDNFKAAGEHTTRSIAQRAFSASNRSNATSLQVELASPLRIMPSDVETITEQTRAIGPYMAYLLLKTYIEESTSHEL
jgi:hypothetical protein